MSVPSLSTLEGVKKYISAMGNAPSAIAPKQTVMLDWASKEDGTHILTITVGNKVCSFLCRGPFKYYGSMFLAFLGPPTYVSILS